MELFQTRIFKKLIRYFGIIPSYLNYKNEKISTPIESIVSLLTSFNVNCQSLETLENSLAGLREKIYSNTEESLCCFEKNATNKNVFFYSDQISDEFSIKLYSVDQKRFLDIKYNNPKLIRKRIFNQNTFCRYKITIEETLDLGYYEILINDNLKINIVIYPKKAYLPDDFTNKKDYKGLLFQLYSLRNNNNWGMGDLGNLNELSNKFTNFDFFALNPLCACSLTEKTYHSPYAPITRQFFDPIYIDIENAKDLINFPDNEYQNLISSHSEIIKSLNDLEVIDFNQVKYLKKNIFLKYFNYFQSNCKVTEKYDEFLNFIEDFGKDLDCYALYEYLSDKHQVANFNYWKEDKDFEYINFEEISKKLAEPLLFYKFLQFLLFKQLEKLRSSSKPELGYMFDFPLGTTSGGLDVWRYKKKFLESFSIGAPPDDYNENGQNWGFSPAKPNFFDNFIASLKSQMKFAKLLRIDHILGFKRLFLIPNGKDGNFGIYLKNQEKKLKAILLLESVKNLCIIIGEDLGTVPKGFSSQLLENNILSTKVLFFMRKENGDFIEPEWYSKMSVAMPSTHDSPTLKGYFQFKDLIARLQSGLIKTQTEFFELCQKRELDLISFLNLAKVDNPQETLRNNKLDFGYDLKYDIYMTIMDYLIASESILKLIPFEELTRQTTLVNLPGCRLEKYPSFRIREKYDLDTILSLPKR